MPGHLRVLAVSMPPPQMLSLLTYHWGTISLREKQRNINNIFNSQRQLNRKRDHNRIHNIIMDLPMYKICCSHVRIVLCFFLSTIFKTLLPQCAMEPHDILCLTLHHRHFIHTTSLKRLPEGKLFIIHVRFPQVVVRQFVRGCARSQQPSSSHCYTERQSFFYLGTFIRSCKVSLFLLSISHSFTCIYMFCATVFWATSTSFQTSAFS